MAGKKHHHIWQHIQRGFAVREFNDDHIWVYRQQKAPERTVTRLHGQEKHFYGVEGSVADQHLTNVESSLVEFINDARNFGDSERLDPKVAGNLVSSLELRSAYLRVEFSQLLKRTIAQLRVHLSASGIMEKAMIAVLKSEPNLFKSEFEKLGAEPAFHETLAQITQDVLPKILIGQKQKTLASIDQHFELMISKAAAIAKDSQIRALEGDFLESQRTASHQDMHFETLRIQGGELVLPDTGLSFFMRNKVRPTSFRADDRVDAILIPISVNVAIIGSRRGGISRPLSVLNSALASCAFDFFIGSKNDIKLRSLIFKIGRNAKLIEDSEIAKIVRSIEF